MEEESIRSGGEFHVILSVQLFDIPLQPYLKRICSMENKREWTFDEIKAKNNGNAYKTQEVINDLIRRKHLLEVRTKKRIAYIPNFPESFDESELIWKE